MKIAVAGTGYVGLSIATLLAQHNEVVAVDVIPEKVEKINMEGLKPPYIMLSNHMHFIDFELAANLRDRLKSVEALGSKQLVTASTLADTDVIGFAQTEVKACFAVLHFSDSIHWHIHRYSGYSLSSCVEKTSFTEETTMSSSVLLKA